MNRQASSKIQSYLNVFLTALKLGFISFGGPIAHLAYFQDEYVSKRKWLNPQQYNELVAIAQFLPGPTSSQVGIGIGTLRAGILGGILSFLGFTLPSMLALIGFASLLNTFTLHSGLMQGLKLVAVAVVAHVLLGMVKPLLQHHWSWIIALHAFLLTLFWTAAIAQPIAIAIAMLLGIVVFKYEPRSNASFTWNITLSKPFAAICLVLFFILLIGLPIISSYVANPSLLMAEQFFRSGSLVFGGGHIVLPLLEREIVLTGQMSSGDFFAGYSATQAVPGPLFTFASYLGYVLNGWAGAIIATISIFLPAFLLMYGVLPFWNVLRRHHLAALAFKGASCGVVGILCSAFLNPILITSISSINTALVAIVLFLLLYRFSCPAWLIVILGPLLGVLFL